MPARGFSISSVTCVPSGPWPSAASAPPPPPSSGRSRSSVPSYTSYTPSTAPSVDSTSSFGAASAAASSSAAPSASGAAAAAAPPAVARAITSSTNRGTIPRPSPTSPSTVYVLPVPVCAGEDGHVVPAVHLRRVRPHQLEQPLLRRRRVSTQSSEYAFTVSSWLPRRGRRGGAARGVRPPASASSSGWVVTATLVPEMVSALSGCAVFSRGSSGRQRTATLKALSSPSVLVLVAVAFGFFGRGGRGCCGGCCGTSSSTAIENWATVCQPVLGAPRDAYYMHTYRLHHRVRLAHRR